MLVTAFKPKPFNQTLLMAELDAAGLSFGDAGRIWAWAWAGFIPPRTQFRIDPYTETTVVGHTNINGVKTETTADPGELRITVPDDWTAGEQSILEGVLNAHDYTVMSDEQTRQAQDSADLDVLRATLDAGPPYALTSETAGQLVRMMLRVARNEDV